MPHRLSDHEAGASYEGDYETDLAELQERVSRLFVANHVHGCTFILACEGWDAAGKGGAIQRLTAKCDPRTYKVWPIAAPSGEEKAHHWLRRFWLRLPKASEGAIFDRSWYGRVLVERVEGLASEAEWRRAFDEINEFEAQLAAGGAVLLKLFFHVTQGEQDKRFRARFEHPWKAWKMSAEDLRNRDRRDDYLDAIHDMLDATDSRWAPWRVIDGNDKKSARIATLSAVADALKSALPSGPPPIRPEMAQLGREFLQAGD